MSGNINFRGNDFNISDFEKAAKAANGLNETPQNVPVRQARPNPVQNDLTTNDKFGNKPEPPKVGFFRAHTHLLSKAQVNQINEAGKLPKNMRFKETANGGFRITTKGFGITRGTRTLPEGYEVKAGLLSAKVVAKEGGDKPPRIGYARIIFHKLSQKQINQVNISKKLPNNAKFVEKDKGFKIVPNFVSVTEGTTTLPAGYELRKSRVFGFTKIVPEGSKSLFLRDNPIAPIPEGFEKRQTIFGGTKILPKDTEGLFIKKRNQ